MVITLCFHLETIKGTRFSQLVIFLLSFTRMTASLVNWQGVTVTTGVLSQSPFAPRFLSRRAAASSSASVVPEVLFLYWQRVRIPCHTIDTRGQLDFLRVTGNCFWFLDLPPVWKGLVFSPSLLLLLVFFLVVRRLPFQLL